MNYSLNNLQEWLTVFGYLGFTVFIMWCVFAAQKQNKS